MRSRGREFDPRPGRGCVTTLGKLFTPNCLDADTVHIANQQSSTMKLVCGVPQGSVLGPILFLVYCADVMAIAHRHGLGVHSYADDSQLYFHADISVADDKVKQLLVCVEEISH